jgi:hypothetical protein
MCREFPETGREAPEVRWQRARRHLPEYGQACRLHKVIAFLKRNNATFTNLHMPLDAAAQKGLVEKFAFKNAIPHAVLFDKTGTRVWAGHPINPQLVSLIERELAKDGPAF